MLGFVLGVYLVDRTGAAVLFGIQAIGRLCFNPVTATMSLENDQ